MSRAPKGRPAARRAREITTYVLKRGLVSLAAHHMLPWALVAGIFRFIPGLREV